jgi:hypothetical protein
MDKITKHYLIDKVRDPDFHGKYAVFHTPAKDPRDLYGVYESKKEAITACKDAELADHKEALAAFYIKRNARNATKRWIKKIVKPATGKTAKAMKSIAKKSTAEPGGSLNLATGELIIKAPKKVQVK